MAEPTAAVLWDIDRTLLDAGPGTRDVLAATVAARAGRTARSSGTSRWPLGSPRLNSTAPISRPGADAIADRAEETQRRRLCSSAHLFCHPAQKLRDRVVQEGADEARKFYSRRMSYTRDGS